MKFYIFIFSIIFVSCQHSIKKSESPTLFQEPTDCRSLQNPELSSASKSIKQGRWECYSGLKKIMVADFKNGLKHGEVQLFDGNEKLESVTFWAEGLLQGPAEYYNADGSLDMTVQYRYGKLHGESVQYDLKGRVRSRSFYEEGVLKTFTEYDENGHALPQNP